MQYIENLAQLDFAALPLLIFAVYGLELCPENLMIVINLHEHSGMYCAAKPRIASFLIVLFLQAFLLCYKPLMNELFK